MSALISAVMALAAGLLGVWSLFWGYLGGVLMGGFLFTGVVVLVCVLIAPPPEAPYTKGQRAAALALQGIKYAVVVGGLYFLLVYCQLNALVVLGGLLTPIVIALGLMLLRPAGRRQVLRRGT